MGRIIELQLLAPSEPEAKRQAEEAGLRFVVVKPLEEEQDSDSSEREERPEPPSC